MTPVERFLSVLESRIEAQESGEFLYEKNWVKDVKTKWHPPEGLFTRSAKEIADYLAKHSPDYATAVRRAVFYYNRGGYCNKGGPRFDEAECRKACRVLRLLAKNFGVAEKERSKSELEFCNAVNEGFETPEALAEEFLEAMEDLERTTFMGVGTDDDEEDDGDEDDAVVDYSPEVFTPVNVSEDKVEEYERALKELLGDDFMSDNGLKAELEKTPFGIQVTFTYPGGFVYFPGEFEFSVANREGLYLSYNVTDVSLLDAMPEKRGYDDIKTLLNNILSAALPMDLEGFDDVIDMTEPE